MGIWMQKKEINGKHGNLTIAFFDTEGFAASNISESYDAKIFAVSTLISSLLLYNSVKIIDQSDIDYLEVLARRTKLFALHSQVSTQKWKTMTFNHDLLTFPPLIWIVQDFVQSATDSQKWLQNLMESHFRENDEYEISLLSIFKSIDCHTMFLPAVQKSLLRDLSKVSEHDLTEEYKAEREDLEQKIYDLLVPKEKEGRPMTGTEMASLIRILVEAANNGSLTSIPSRWDSFVRNLITTAIVDCATYYRSVLESFDEALPPKEMQDLHRATEQKSYEMLAQLLLGYGIRVNEARDALGKKIEKYSKIIQRYNERKISLMITQIRNEIEEEFDKNLYHISLPHPSVQYQKIIEKLLVELPKRYQKMIIDYVDEQRLEEECSLINRSLILHARSYQTKNYKAFLEEMETAADTSFRLVHSAMDEFVTCLTTTDMEDKISELIQMYNESFVEGCSKSRDEEIFAIYKLRYEKLLMSKIGELREKNLRLLKEKLSSGVEVSALKIVKVVVKLPQHDLNKLLDLKGKAIIREFSEEFADYKDSSQFHSSLKILHVNLILFTVI
ncbi:DgyrCDS2977 [Dimorphilus gyrociliatus]|uniref:DgyrCDS2977 n=1 Tax=Dimorphilus gyrociliatus TaxID=2664684 RepID=A0A7I8VD23_9ANNE|nr:DgyrCDS2977 [Dimorphilus gyrociliatus]